MKANEVQNVALLDYLEQQMAEGKTVDECRSAAIKHFKYGGKDPSHSLRAHLARLANPAKYKGMYAERARKFQKQRTQKTKETPVEAQAEVEQVKEPTSVEN